MGVGGQCCGPAALPLGKTPVSIVQEAGWAPGLVWKGAENLAPTTIRSLDRPACSAATILSYPSPHSDHYTTTKLKYRLILGTAHYHTILISHNCKFYAYQLFIYSGVGYTE